MTAPASAPRERQLALLGTIAGEVLRELTDPITAILSHAELLCDPDRPLHELQESVGSILHEALRCRRILSVVGSLGGGTQQFQAVDVEALAADVALAVAARRRPDDPDVRFHSHGGSAWVRADRALLSEVIAGLVEAAVEERLALGDGGHVEVTSLGSEEGVEIAIRHDLSANAAEEPLPLQTLMAKVAALLLELHGGTMELRGDREHGARIILRMKRLEQPGRELTAVGSEASRGPGRPGG